MSTLAKADVSGPPNAATGEEIAGRDDRARRFRDAYARHRAAEGRAASAAELFALPFLREGPLAHQWRVRARTFLCFVKHVLDARAAEVAPRPLRVLDLGSGNGWLCYRIARQGHAALAIDLRTDAVDGLGAAAQYADRLSPIFPRIAASFETLPLADDCTDIAVFNASLHYALDLQHALMEAERVVMPGGRITILDSPFYASVEDGDAMVEEKLRRAPQQFGVLAQDLVALPFVEYLTPERLESASASPGLVWRRHRVRYPFAYEVRPLLAKLRRGRTPSRFDLWEAVVS